MGTNTEPSLPPRYFRRRLAKRTTAPHALGQGDLVCSVRAVWGTVWGIQ
ncbi:MAG: hypothetical protein VYC47_01735 [Verrucomicrobiota bacterium]|nr:hypothetical protein [Verrucomicrobiota bacterium]